MKLTIPELYSIQKALEARVEWLKEDEMSPDEETGCRSALEKFKDCHLTMGAGEWG